MSTITTNPTPTPVVPSLPNRAGARPPAPTESPGLRDLYRLTVDEYERIGGMLDDDRVELIDGHLVRKMGKRPPHITAVENVIEELGPILPAGFFCRKEDPVRIPESGEPEPDVSTLRGSRRDYDARLPEPQDVALLVEVSETGLDRDRGPKPLAYARGGIPIDWIVNLVDCRIEVYSDPSADGYRTRQDFQAGQEVPIVIDGTEIGRVAAPAILP